MFKNFDWLLFIAMILLIALGVLMISSTALGESRNYDLAIRQVVFAALGLVAFFAVARFDYEIWRPLSYLLYGLSIFLLLAVFIYGLEIRGSLRWIDLGVFRLQPAELVKLSTILLLANLFTSLDMRRLKNIALSFLLVFLPAALVYLQPDLGSAVVLIVIWLGMILATNVSKKYIFIGGLALVLIFPLAFNFLQPYQKERLLSFLNPGSDPLGTGYNVIQSTIAVGSGGLWGRGFGRGTQSHLNFLPEHHTDFIFATLAEELGLFGSLVLLTLLGVLLWRIGRAIHRASRFGGLILVGLLVLISFQAAVNIGMNIGLAPITGITLPLVSYGGSSLISTMVGLGLAEAIIRTNSTVDEEPDLG